MLVEKGRIARHDFPSVALYSEKQLRSAAQVDRLSPEFSLHEGCYAHAVCPASDQSDVEIDL